MRVISKFHDYYDKVQGLGFDSSLTFVRAQEVYGMDAKDQPYPLLVKAMFDLMPGTRGAPRASFAPGLVLLGGRLYPYFVKADRDRHGWPLTTPARIGYDLADMTAQHVAAGGEAAGLTVPTILRRFTGELGPSWEQFLSLKGDDRFHGAASAERLPILQVQRTRDDAVIVNPKLADIEFYRTLDAWQAQQELEMFLGNLALPENNVVRVTDKDRVQQHGFDERSFRKDPQPTRAGRRRNA